MLLWENKLFIGGLVILAIIISFLFSTLFISKEYKSEAKVLAPDFQLLDGDQISKEEYISFLNSDKVIEKIIEVANQSENETEITGEKLTNNLSYNLSENTNQIEFSFRFTNPEKTKMILNEWLNLFINRVDAHVNDQNNSYYENVSNKVEEDHEKYKSILDKKTNFESKNNLNLLRKELTSKGNKLIDLNSEIIELRNKISASEKELDFINSRLENTEKYLVRKNLISDDFLQKVKAINSEQELINLLRTEEEFLNPEHENLTNKEINLLTNLSSRENNLENYIEDREILEEETTELQKNISFLTEEKTVIDNELSNRKNAYENSNEKLNELEQNLVENEYNITMLASPKKPENPVSPNVKLNMAIAAVLALMLGVFIVFFKEFMKENN